MVLETWTLPLSLLVLVVTLLFVYTTYGTKWRRYVKLIDALPGPPLKFLLGNALEEMVPRNKIMGVQIERYKLYGPIYRSWSGNAAEVHLTKADHVEVILGSTTHIEKAWMYSFMKPWLGLGLLTSSGAKWHSRRKMITPTFHFKILETFLEVFVEKSQVMVEKLQKEVALHGKDGIDIHPFLTRCALDIICQTAMGTDIRAQEDTHSEYVRAIAEISEAIIQRAVRPYLHSDMIFNLTDRGRQYNKLLDILHGFTSKVIQERKAEHQKSADKSDEEISEEDKLLGKKRRIAFLDLLLEARGDDGDHLTDAEVREEVDTFMFEGHDTTTAGTSWALFLLGSHPDIQAKVHAELDSIYQGSDRPITFRDVQEMKYLDRVIKETLRLYPSVPFIGRNLQEDVMCGDYLIPAGCTINIEIYHVHRNPEYFPNPEAFDPDHFLAERVQGRHPYAYIPFSAGPRNCIGQKFAMMEEKTMIASVLRHFTVRTLEERGDLVLINELILRCESGVRVILAPRER